MEFSFGHKVGNYSFVKELEKRFTKANSQRIVLCKCICGSDVKLTLFNFIHNRSNSCGCIKKQHKRICFIGKKFGLVTILKEVDDLVVNSRNIRMVIGECDCGTVKQYRLSVIRYVKSCGCKTNEIVLSHTVRHNCTSTRLYRIWQGMKNRCYNERIKSYNYYGKRGIIVCNDWLSFFENFRDWAFDNGYKDTLTLDRKNVHGNYEPSNCRWATLKEQANNKTNTKRLFYKGEYLTLAELCDKYNLVYTRVEARINELKWNLEDAVITERMNPISNFKNVTNERAEELKYKIRNLDNIATN